MKIIPISQAEAITATSEVLKKDGLVVSPSDTVYGLLADACNQKALMKLIAFKNRPPGKPLSIFVSDIEMLKKYVELESRQQDTLTSLLPGPFTVILPSLGSTSRLLESEKKTLGVRIPDYPLIINLVKTYGLPLTATSANLSGRSPHYSVESLLNELPQSKKNLIDLIVDGGRLPRNKPSTVIDLTTPQLKIIRKGDIVSRDSKTYKSKTPNQTKKIAQYILRRFIKLNKKKALVFILEGELGAGKTVFVKGIGEVLGINNVVSPTYVISYEYKSRNNTIFKKMVHFDLYQLEDPTEFKHLGIKEVLKPGTLFCFEWGEKSGEIFHLIKNKAVVVYIEIKYINETEREIKVRKLTVNSS